MKLFICKFSLPPVPSPELVVENSQRVCSSLNIDPKYDRSHNRQNYFFVYFNLLCF
jgi:hypothetical protein